MSTTPDAGCQMSHAEAEKIKRYFKDRMSEVEQVMEKAAQALSDYASYLDGAPAAAQKIGH